VVVIVGSQGGGSSGGHGLDRSASANSSLPADRVRGRWPAPIAT